MKPLLIGIALITAACASSGNNAARRKSCVVTANDSIFAARGSVYLNCGVDRAAHLTTTNIHPDFRPTTTGTPKSACYSADLEFVVDTMGRPETQTARVVHTNDQGYAESVLATLSAWKYDPAVLDQKPVRQIVTTHQSMASVVTVVRSGTPATRPPANAVPKC